jgi:hypothetical protein
MQSREDRIIEAARQEALGEHPSARPDALEIHALTLLQRAVLVARSAVRRRLVTGEAPEIADHGEVPSREDA